jgi:hypothetical protein
MTFPGHAPSSFIETPHIEYRGRNYSSVKNKKTIAISTILKF